MKKVRDEFNKRSTISFSISIDKVKHEPNSYQLMSKAQTYSGNCLIHPPTIQPPTCNLSL